MRPVKVPLYGVFGDNFIMTLTSLARSARLVRNAVEVDIDELRGAVSVAAEVAQARQRLVFPLTGNEKKPFGEALRAVGVQSFDPRQTPIHEVLQKVADSLDSLLSGSGVKVTPPSILKADYYERMRKPMYFGSRKFSLKVDSAYVLLSLAGWVLSRLGRARVREGEYVGVYVFPVGFDARFAAMPALLRHVNEVPGVSPVPALVLWLASRVLEHGVDVDWARIYVVREAGGQAPSEVVSGFMVGLGSILGSDWFRRHHGVVGKVAERALSIDEDECGSRDFSVRVSVMLYEVLNGAGRAEELAYAASREYAIVSRGSGMPGRCVGFFRSVAEAVGELVVRRGGGGQHWV